MRRESKLLLNKAIDSLLLAIELYNRPNDRGRVNSVLILTDHANEMFLKAAIVQKGAKIHDRGSSETIGFDACVRRATSNSAIRFLTEDQALALRMFNSLRDAAQHYLVHISENQLYVHVQSAVTLFRDLLQSVFAIDLADELPDRVLPISTSPPMEISSIFQSDVSTILKLLAPGRRRRIEAESRLRSLALLDSGMRGKHGQLSPNELRRIGRDLAEKHWSDVFSGAAVVDVTTDGVGPAISIRLTKREGPPIRIVTPDTDAPSVAVRRVNELDFYSLSAKQLATKVGLTTPKLIAVVEYTGMRNDPDCYKEFRIGSSRHKRYSQKAIAAAKGTLSDMTIQEIWEWDKERKRQSRQSS